MRWCNLCQSDRCYHDIEIIDELKQENKRLNDLLIEHEKAVKIATEYLQRLRGLLKEFEFVGCYCETGTIKCAACRLKELEG